MVSVAPVLNTSVSKVVAACRWRRYVALWLLLVSVSLAQAERNFIVVYTWPEYFDPRLLAEFEQEFGVEVKEVWYENDEAKDANFYRFYKGQVDIIVSSGAALYPYIKQGQLVALPEDLKRSALEPTVADLNPELLRYALPYTWGTMGVAYRRDLTDVRFDTWLDFFQPVESLHGKMVSVDDGQDLYSLALIALGVGIGDADEQAINQAHQLLLSQKPAVASYRYMDPSEHASLVSGEATVALMYNGDALMMQDYHDDIAFSVPAEGSLLWVDYLAIDVESKHIKAAKAFIEFFNRPEVSARNVNFLYFASPFVAARQWIEPAILDNRAVYPDQGVLRRLQLQPRLTLEQKLIYNRLLAELKR